MRLTSTNFIRETLEKHNAKPLKKLGQNFLISQGVLEKMVNEANLEEGDVVLEIGPGIGVLTAELAKKAERVIAVEKDKKMVEILKETLEGSKNVEIICADILKTNIKELGLKDRGYKLVSNLPYYISSPVIRKFLEEETRPEYMVLMLQKEVAQRVCCLPSSAEQRKMGNPKFKSKEKMSLLSLFVSFYAEAKMVAKISRGSFWPRPKVDSAIIKITPKNIVLAKENIVLFSRIARAGFSQPRKQILNTLSKSLNLEKEKIKSWLLQNKINPKARAEDLNLEQWISLSQTFPLDS